MYDSSLPRPTGKEKNRCGADGFVRSFHQYALTAVLNIFQSRRFFAKEWWLCTETAALGGSRCVNYFKCSWVSSIKKSIDPPPGYSGYVCEICWNFNHYVISCVRVVLCHSGVFAFSWHEFDDKRKAADGLIISISATSDHVQVEWKIWTLLILPLYLLSNLTFLFNLVCTPCTPMLVKALKVMV